MDIYKIKLHLQKKLSETNDDNYWIKSIKEYKKQKSLMPNHAIIKDIEYRNIPLKLIFIPENTENSDMNILLSRYIHQYLPKRAKTGRNEFQAYMVSQDFMEMYGFSTGKYAKTIFDEISRFKLLRESEIKWIQIFSQYTGKGLCEILMTFLIQNLDLLNVDNIVVDNIGGLPACKCYVKAGIKMGLKPINIVGGDPKNYENWYNVNCNKDAEITHLFFERDFMYKTYSTLT